MAMRFVNLGRIAHHLPALEEDDIVLAHFKVDIAHVVVGHGPPTRIRSYKAIPF